MLLSFYLIALVVSDQVQDEINHLTETFTHSHKASGTFGVWWTPDVAGNTLKLAAYCRYKGWCGVALQTAPKYTAMVGLGIVGVNIVGVDVQPYKLQGPLQASKYTTNPILEATRTTVIVDSLFIEATLDFKKPNGVDQFSYNTSFVLINAAFDMPEDPIKSIHKDNAVSMAIDLVTGTGATPYARVIPPVIPPPPVTTPVASPVTLHITPPVTPPVTPTTVVGKCVGSLLPPDCKKSSYPNMVEMKSDTTGELVSTVYFQVKDNIAYFDVVGESNMNQYLALGFSKTGDMVDSHAVIAPQTQPMFTKYLSSQDPNDWNQESFDLIEPQSALVGNYLVMHFGRRTDDPAYPMGELGAISLISAVGNTAYPDYHAARAPGVTVNLLNGAVTTPVGLPPEQIHGIIMTLAWDFIIPFGYVWARFIKKAHTSDLWWQGHRLAMTIGLLVCLVGAALAFGMVGPGGHFDTKWHSQVGLLTISLMLYQVSSGIMRPHPANKGQPKPLARLIFEATHHIFGRTAIIASWAAIAGGILEADLKMGFLIAHAIIVGLWVVLMIILEVKARIAEASKEYVAINQSGEKKV